MILDLRQRRHLLFTMLTACAWRDTPAGAQPIVAGLRAFLGGWLGVGRIVTGSVGGEKHSFGLPPRPRRPPGAA